MAAIVAGAGFDPARLHARLAEALPAYARPLVLRVVRDLPATETFKIAHARLAADGFDPDRIGDPLYIADPAAGAYAPLDAALYGRLAAGEWRG